MLGASNSKETLDDDLVAFGMDASFLPDSEPDEFELYQENLQAFDVFCSSATQWRYAGMTGVQTGLDYSAVESVMRMMGTEDTAETFQKVRLIEMGALNAMSEQRG